MEILYLLIPVSILFLLVAVAAFVWAVKNGQFEDMEGPAYRIIMDDDNDPLIPAPPVQKNARESHKGSESNSEQN